MKEISVVIPAFNEEGMITRTLAETCAVLCGHDYEIIVVDDGSRDGTFAEVGAFARDHPEVRVLRLEYNGGKGAALRLGTEAAQGDLIAFLDADLDIHPRQIWLLLDAMRAGGADVAVGSKHLTDSRVTSPLPRRFLSRAFSWLEKALFNLELSDTQTGLKLFRAEVLRRAFPRVRVQRYAFDLELLVAASRFGYRIVEVPVAVSFQRSGAGRIGLRSMLNMLWDLISIYYRASFWRWLEPSLTTKIWMVVLAMGIFTTGVSVGRFLSRVWVPPWLRELLWYATLRFLPSQWRDLLLLAGGLTLTIVALVNLNKHLMSAFARPDRGDLAGIHRATNGPRLPAQETEAEEMVPEAHEGAAP
ncbi:MAG: glycosyltransferase family 2 protein [Anaerolineae bacterium]|nr:glycosyltransferase family 2 protein [Anaerolineae bacterium]